MLEVMSEGFFCGPVQESANYHLKEPAAVSGPFQIPPRFASMQCEHSQPIL